jgi:hypothetical protein
MKHENLPTDDYDQTVAVTEADIRNGIIRTLAFAGVMVGLIAILKFT